MFLAFVISNTAWVYYEAQYTDTSVEIEADQQADNNGNNYIVNGDYGETAR
jgi:hypothetical protein